MSDCRSSTKEKDPIECSKHLLYEIEMFYCLGKRLLERKERDWVLDNALLEAFLVHTRILSHFFSEGPDRDDVDIETYFCIKPRECLSDMDVRRINKRLAHLTRIRIKPEEGQDTWSVPEFLATIGQMVEDFVEKVKDPRVCDEFKERVTRCVLDYRESQRSQPHISSQNLSTSDQSAPSVVVLEANSTQPQEGWNLAAFMRLVLIRVIRLIRG